MFIHTFSWVLQKQYQLFQEKVVAEILEVVGPTGHVLLSHLPKLKLLERVIKETLRIFPVGSFIVRKVDEDIDIGKSITSYQ